MESKRKTNYLFGLIGTLIGFLALVLGLLGDHIGEAIDPPPPPTPTPTPRVTAGERAQAAASSLRDRAVSVFRRNQEESAASEVEEIIEESPVPEKDEIESRPPSEYIPIITLSGGLLALGLGIVSVVREERRVISVFSILLAAATLALQFLFELTVISGAIILLFFLYWYIFRGGFTFFD